MILSKPRLASRRGRGFKRWRRNLIALKPDILVADSPASMAENKLALPPVLRKAHDAHLQHYAGLAFLRSRVNALLAAAGYNFSLLLRWFEELLWSSR